MSKRKRSSFSLFSLIAFILLLVVLVAVIYYLSRGLNGYESFYVRLGEESIKDTAEVTLYSFNDYRFDILYPPDLLSQGEQKGYTVKIIPGEVYVDYIIGDGVYMYYNSGLDLTPAFNITLKEDYFLLTVPGECSLSDVLSKLLNEPVELVGDLSDSFLYKMIISSKDGSRSVVISFGMIPLTLKIDPVSIIF